MDKIERTDCRRIADTIQKHLKAAADELGLTVTVGGGSFDNLSYSPKITFAVKDTSGADASARRDWNLYCHRLGLRPEHFGGSFMHKGHRHVIKGINPSAPTYPILAERQYDKRGIRFGRFVIPLITPKTAIPTTEPAGSVPPITSSPAWKGSGGTW